MPWEGFNVVINGSKGRIEMKVVEQSYINAGGEKGDEGAVNSKKIKVFPMFSSSHELAIEEGTGGHGGGDPVLLNDILGIPEEDEFNHAASNVDGALSILTGIAANKSIASKQAVDIEDLVVLNN